MPALALKLRGRCQYSVAVMPQCLDDAIAIRMSGLDDVCSFASQPLVVREWWLTEILESFELFAKGRHRKRTITVRELLASSPLRP